MTQDLNHLITAAAPPLPDSGPSRRVSRALLHQRMRLHLRRNAIRKRWHLSLAAGLAFILVTGVQVAELGSDGFDFDIVTKELGNGDTLTLATGNLKQYRTNVPAGWTEDDIRESYQQSLLREGKIVEISGFAFADERPHLQILYKKTVNGKIIWSGVEPIRLSIPNHSPHGSDKHLFFSLHSAAYVGAVDAGEFKGTFFADVVADGITYRVYRFKREFPNWGTVSYYRGLPLAADSVSSPLGT